MELNSMHVTFAPMGVPCTLSMDGGAPSYWGEQLHAAPLGEA